jgi:hypothetical protein
MVSRLRLVICECFPKAISVGAVSEAVSNNMHQAMHSFAMRVKQSQRAQTLLATYSRAEMEHLKVSQDMQSRKQLEQAIKLLWQLLTPPRNG